MFELKITIDDIDYENAAEGLIPLLAAELAKDNTNPLYRAFANNQQTVTGAAKALLRLLSQKQKDDLVLKCFDANKDKIVSKVEKEAMRKNIKINIKSVELLKK